MAGNATSDWTIPVQFYFRVDFQRGKEHFQASFMEVSGLNMQLQTENKPNDEMTQIQVPNGLSHGNVTLRHPLMPLSDKFTEWINGCFTYIEKSPREIKAFDMVIKLLNKDGKPLAGWLCSHAYPIQWNLDSLDSMKSELSKESIVMACNRLKRITNIR
ncbi:phage tail protein [Phocaeicola barnesiae]